MTEQRVTKSRNIGGSSSSRHRYDEVAVDADGSLAFPTSPQLPLPAAPSPSPSSVRHSPPSFYPYRHSPAEDSDIKLDSDDTENPTSESLTTKVRTRTRLPNALEPGPFATASTEPNLSRLPTRKSVPPHAEGARLFTSSIPEFCGNYSRPSRHQARRAITACWRSS